MDHHCFFIANCVGAYNYQFFLSYICYTPINSLISVYLCWPYLAQMVRFEFLRMKVSVIMVFITSLFGFFFGIFTLGLFINHLYLIINERSSVDEAYKGEAGSKFSYWRCFKYFIGVSDKSIDECFQNAKQSIFGTSHFYKVFWPDVKTASTKT